MYGGGRKRKRSSGGGSRRISATRNFNLSYGQDALSYNNIKERTGPVGSDQMGPRLFSQNVGEYRFDSHRIFDYYENLSHDLWGFRINGTVTLDYSSRTSELNVSSGPLKPAADALTNLRGMTMVKGGWYLVRMQGNNAPEAPLAETLSLTRKEFFKPASEVLQSGHFTTSASTMSVMPGRINGRFRNARIIKNEQTLWLVIYTENAKIPLSFNIGIRYKTNP
eukprot:TRINITY_DN78_c0_g3_i9.p1 TRINITY_DN78_c0_g3~~TRINITY_DN78_c0_g3_i9.p1  ORF type:complete len:223 (-),score=8.69 TRINITY_DN78_c0_g3_i9:300-968(-)